MSFKSLRSLSGFGSNYNQVYSMEMFSDFDIHLDHELESFQHQVFTQFKNLSESHKDEFLSLNWLSDLLDAFIACHQDFNSILTKHEEDFTKPPLNKLLKQFLNTSVKSLDICNVVCYGIEKIRCWHKHLEIVSTALNPQKVMTKGQFRRAKKSLTDLSILLNDNKDSGWFIKRRFKSFKGKDNRHKSLSWSVPSSWSATKQLQSMAKRLTPPRANEITATRGLANVVFTMGFVHLFVLWALMAAIPFQDRGFFHTSFSIPKHFLWSTPISLIYVRIMNESKKRDRKNNVGLLKENSQMEKSVLFVSNLVESTHRFPLTEEEMEKVESGVNEVFLVSDAYERWLHPLECQVRVAFREIMSCRSEGLQILCRT